MATPTLIDRIGKALVVLTGKPKSAAAPDATLTEEVARPDIVGVRQAWSSASAVSGLTPDRLDAILRQANTGDMDALLTLAEEMEERDPHYGSVLQTRKLAVLGLERKLNWSKGKETDPRADKILEACQALIDEPNFEDLLFHLLDAIAKGYAAPEIIWEQTPDVWRPDRYEWRDPRWFRFDRATARELRLKETGAIDGVELPPWKFAVHFATRKSGIPARAGLARLVAFSFVCKLYGLKDWMAYAEIFGIPMRLGRYDASASPDDVDVLKRAVFGLGSDAAAVFPKSMEIEFPDLGAAQGYELFHMLVTFLDGQVSKAVLGQNGTTDMQKGGGFAQAKVLDGVRDDLLEADAKGVAGTVTSDVLTPFVMFNFGPDAPVPSLELVIPDVEDLAALGSFLQQVVPLGLRVSQAEIRKRAKISEPADGDELLTPPARAPALGPHDPAAPKPPGLARDSRLADLAHTLDHAAAEADLEAAQLAELDNWQRVWGPEAQAVIDVVRKGGSFEDIAAGLNALAGDLAATAPARSLARAMFEAAAIGQGGARRKEA